MNRDQNLSARELGKMREKLQVEVDRDTNVLMVHSL